jgi:hypothetical protein
MYLFDMAGMFSTAHFHLAMLTAPTGYGQDRDGLTESRQGRKSQHQQQDIDE